MVFDVDVSDDESGKSRHCKVVINDKKTEHQIKIANYLVNIRKSNNPFEPNYPLYFGLILTSLIIIVISACFPNCTPWFSIWSGIGCGSLASSIIGFLVDKSNSNVFYRKACDNRDVILDRFQKSFESGLQIIILYMRNETNDIKPRKWTEWVEDASDILRKNASFKREYLYCMRKFFDRVGEEAYEIKTQSALLLNNDILTGEDVKRIKDIIDICDVANAEFEMEKETQKLIEFSSEMCNILKGFVSYSDNFKYINDLEIGLNDYNSSNK